MYVVSLQQVMVLLLMVSQLAAVEAEFVNGKVYTYSFKSQADSGISGQQQQQQQQQPLTSLTAQVQVQLRRFANEKLLLTVRLSEIRSSSSSSSSSSSVPADAASQLHLLSAEDTTWYNSLYVSPKEPESVVNVARSVTSLLRHRQRPEGEESFLPDLFGECVMKWRSVEDGNKKEQIKELTDCSSASISGKASSRSQFRVSVNSSARMQLSFNEEGVVTFAEASGRHLADASDVVSVSVVSSATLELRDVQQADEDTASSQQSVTEFLGEGGFLEVLLPLQSSDASSSDSSSEQQQQQQFKESVKSFKKSISSESPSKQAAGFLSALQLARSLTDAKPLQQQLKSQAGGEFLGDLLEVLVACGTRACLTVSFDFVSKSLSGKSTGVVTDSIANRFFVSVQQSPSVTKLLMERTAQLMQQLQQRRQQRQLAAAAAAALASIARRQQRQQLSGAEFDVADILLNQFSNCVTEKDSEAPFSVEVEDCLLRVMAAMENLPDARYQQQMQQILTSSKSTNSAELQCAALRVLASSISSSPSAKSFLLQLLHGDWSVRSDTPQLLQLLLVVGPEAAAEAAQLLAKRIPCDVWLLLRQRWSSLSLRSATAFCLLEVAASSSSSSFSEGSVVASGGKAGELGYRLQLLGNRMGGVRRSGFDLIRSRGMGSSDGVLGVRIYADAVDSLLSSDSSEIPEDSDQQHQQEPTSGLQLQLLGEVQTPFRFFTGSSGLMSAAWNAPTEQTPILSASIVGHDFLQQLPTVGGQFLEVSIVTAATVRVSGSLSISFWNRDALSKVRTEAGLASTARAGAGQSHAVSGFGQSELATEFNSFVSFAEQPISTCLELHRLKSPSLKLQSACLSLGDRTDRSCASFEEDD